MMLLWNPNARSNQMAYSEQLYSGEYADEEAGEGGEEGGEGRSGAGSMGNIYGKQEMELAAPDENWAPGGQGAGKDTEVNGVEHSRGGLSKEAQKALS